MGLARLPNLLTDQPRLEYMAQTAKILALLTPLKQWPPSSRNESRPMTNSEILFGAINHAHFWASAGRVSGIARIFAACGITVTGTDSKIFLS